MIIATFNGGASSVQVGFTTEEACMYAGKTMATQIAKDQKVTVSYGCFKQG